MFKFFKDKLKGAISKFSQKVEEEGEERVEEQPKGEEKEAKKGEESTGELERKEKPEEGKKEESEKPGKEEKTVAEVKESEKEKAGKGEKIPGPEEKSKEQVGLTRTQEKISEKAEGEKTREKSQPDATLEQPKAEVKKALEKESLEEKSDVEKAAGVHEPKKEVPGRVEEEKERPEEGRKKGFFGRLTEKITTTKISSDKFESLFSDLELILLENNVAMEVIEKIRDDLRGSIADKPIKRNKVEEAIRESLKNSINDLFQVEDFDLFDLISKKEEKPFVIAFFGVNGSGKTTSISKVANMLKKNGFSCVMAASDTFRAASIEQLQHHAEKLGVKLIKHGYQSDPAAVAFDAIKHAKSKNVDVVLVDTAGRLHSQGNLMDELKKVVRVSNPDLKLFVGESITGNDCVEQAQKFNDAVGIDGLILTKADVDEKGGAAISASYVTKKPIVYLGIGQNYGDLKKFEPGIVVEGLGL